MRDHFMRFVTSSKNRRVVSLSLSSLLSEQRVEESDVWLWEPALGK
jgi:hypothetical protein